MATSTTKHDDHTAKAATAEQAEVIQKNRDSLPAVDADTAKRDRLALENAQATAQAEADAAVLAARAKVDAATLEFKAAQAVAKNVETGLVDVPRGRLAHDRNAS